MSADTLSVLPNSLAIQCLEHQPEPIVTAWGDATWSLADVGPIHGAILVERTRTFGTKLKDLRWNVQRLKTGAQTLGFNAESVIECYSKFCLMLLEVNRVAIAEQDVSVIALFSPHEVDGRFSWKGIGYLAPIPRSRLERWYKEGCDLTTTNIGLIPNLVFPTSLKHRSRIHYWLADQRAQALRPQSVALLIDDNKRIGDCSMANLILIDDRGRWLTPEPQYSHHGTTLTQSMQLLNRAGITVESCSIAYEDAIACREIIMVGSTGVVWPAASLDNTSFSKERVHCRHLQDLWVKSLSYDFTAI